MLRGDPLAAADALERLQDGFPAGAVALEERLALAADVGDAEEQVLRADVLIAEALGFRLGTLDGLARPRIDAQRSALDPGPACQGGRDVAAEGGKVDAEAAQGLGRDPIVGFDEGAQQMLRVEDRAVEAAGRLLGGDDGLLGLLGESIELHVRSRWFVGRVGRRCR